VWTALHPKGEVKCFFSVELPHGQRGEFSKVWFFSMSAYLRALLDEHITIEMPDTARRLQWLSRIVSIVE
jgi:hypothetical protein